MLELALHFFNNYTIFFYILLTISVIIEWPIIILWLSLIAPKLWFWFFEILFFAFIWDFWGDLLHYFIWKFFKNKIAKKNFSVIKKIEKKLKKHSLLDKLIVIKYTPPITSIGLLYLWYTKISLKKFIKNDIILSIFSSIFITSIWYNFWNYFKDNNNFGYFIILLFFSFIVFYIFLKLITKYLIKKIYE